MLARKERELFAPLSQLPVAERVDALCDIFHSQWCRGSRPDFTHFLNHCTTNEQNQLFTELLLLECDLLDETSEEIDWDHYLGRYPSYAEQIEAVRFQRSTSLTARASETVSCETARRVGHYSLQEKIGTGATGNVWKARDELLQRLVAVKVSNCLQLSDREVRRFLREAQTASRLTHPGVARVHAVDKTIDTVYIVSELVLGADLRKQLRSESPSYQQAAEWCEQIAHALHYAHNEGVVHRDIKPANILIDENGKAILTDFGLAKQISSHSSISLGGNLLGTPAYMSPEQANGQAHRADGRSDIYSLGVVLYEMLARRTPFKGSSDEILKSKLTTESPRLRRLDKSIPRDLELICAKCLAKDPKNRYQNANDLADDLKRFLNQIPIKSSKYRVMTLAFHFARRKIMISAALAAILGICIASYLIAHMPGIRAVLREVRLNTTPNGAEIAFVPLSEMGEPNLDRMTLAGNSPVKVNLIPGDYYVEAALPDGRFQDVLRHVPKIDETLRDTERHSFWKLSNGQITLPDIQIPLNPINQGMILISKLDELRSIESGGNEKLKAYYIDASELTVSGYLAVFPNLPHYLADLQLKDNEPIPLKYDDAVAYAEMVGKRLPTKAEWECAQSTLAPRTSSDFAEWTSNSVSAIPVGDIHSGQIACGGSDRLASNMVNLAPADFAASAWVVLSQDQFYPKVGVRYVRDAAPRFLSKQSTSASRSNDDEAAPTPSPDLNN